MEDLGQNGAILIDAQNMIYGAPNFNEKSFSLFFIGPKEFNVIPGNGDGENNVLKKQWQEIRTKTQAPNRLLWRQIFSNHFDQHALYKSTNVGKSKAKISGYKLYTFSIDDLEFTSVVHYLLFKLYLPDPEYAILFSLESREIETAFWGLVETALNEHKKNMKTGNRAYAQDFVEKLPEYIYNATLAKISQHNDLKEVLIATGDAYLAERIEAGQIYKIGKPILMKVRETLSENPDLIYMKSDQTDAIPEGVITKMRKIREVESYNRGYDPNNSQIGGSVSIDSLYKPLDREALISTFVKGVIPEKETIRKDLRWIYKVTKPIVVDHPQDIITDSNYTFRVVERNVYGFTRNFDSFSSNVIIGYEKFATSKKKLYLRYETKKGSFYFEPVLKENGLVYILFVVNNELDETIFSFFKENLVFDDSPAIPPQVKILELPQVIFTPSQQRRINNNRTLITQPITVAQAAFQYSRIHDFMKNKRIQSFSDITKREIFGALRQELKLRSYTNGETLVYAPGSSFIREFSSRFGLDAKLVKTYLEIPVIPDETQYIEKLPNDVANPPEGISLKNWILIKTIEDVDNVLNLPVSFIRELSLKTKIDEIVFRPVPFKDDETFRGFSWMENLPAPKENQRGVVLICEVPNQKNIEGIFLERLINRIQEAKDQNRLIQILITCRTRGPLYDFLMNSQGVIFRRTLGQDFIFENPFTGTLMNNKTDLLMSVVTNDPNFSSLDFEVLSQ